jgi:hypothetical protein
VISPNNSSGWFQFEGALHTGASTGERGQTNEREKVVKLRTQTSKADQLTASTVKLLIEDTKCKDPRGRLMAEAWFPEDYEG